MSTDCNNRELREQSPYPIAIFLNRDSGEVHVYAADSSALLSVYVQFLLERLAASVHYCSQCRARNGEMLTSRTRLETLRSDTKQVIQLFGCDHLAVGNRRYFDRDPFSRLRGCFGGSAFSKWTSDG